jgi:hypothetical protein
MREFLLRRTFPREAAGVSCSGYREVVFGGTRMSELFDRCTRRRSGRSFERPRLPQLQQAAYDFRFEPESGCFCGAARRDRRLVERSGRLFPQYEHPWLGLADCIWLPRAERCNAGRTNADG